MPDSRISTTSVLSPTPNSAGLDALGIVDLTIPSPGRASGSGASNPHHLASHTSSSGSASTFHDVNSRHNGAGGGGGGGGIPSSQQRHHSAASAAQQQQQSYRNAYAQPYRGTYTTTADADLSAEALGLPPDTEITRIGEGESFRVRAVYDFEATDESALSFRAGDVIEVLTMLPSGWWDGMLGANRGWFPSNYVEDYDDDDDSRYGDYVEMAPDGSIIHRNGSTVADILGVDDGLGRGWGGRDWVMDGSTSSLDDLLALEMMEERVHHGEPGSKHMSSRRRTDSRASWSSRISRSSRASYQSTGRVGPAAVTAGARRSGDDDQTYDDPDETLHASLHARSHRDAWVPSLTADGRVSPYFGVQKGFKGGLCARKEGNLRTFD